MRGGARKRVGKRSPASLGYINQLVEMDVPKELDTDTNRSSVGGVVEGHVIKLRHLGISRHGGVPSLPFSAHSTSHAGIPRLSSSPASSLHSPAPSGSSHYVVHDAVVAHRPCFDRPFTPTFLSPFTVLGSSNVRMLSVQNVQRQRPPLGSTSFRISAMPLPTRLHLYPTIHLLITRF